MSSTMYRRRNIRTTMAMGRSEGFLILASLRLGVLGTGYTCMLLGLDVRHSALKRAG